MTTALTTNFEDKVNAVVEDWKSHDEMFYHDRSMRTIVWYVAKVKTLMEASAEIRAADRVKFVEAVGARYGMKLRRIQEATAVYKHYVKAGDSVMEISEKIFQDRGNWSNAIQLALPAKEAEVEPPEHNHLFVCKCGEIYHP